MLTTILSDNRSIDPAAYQVEHGLAVLLQTNTHKILMDTGASGLFIRNAEALGVGLSDVDYLFLSHGHYDHTGGLAAFLDINDKAKVIVSPHAVKGRFYSRKGGLHSIFREWPLERMKGRTVFVERTSDIDNDIKVIAGIKRAHPLPLGDRHLLAERDGELVLDDFRHEIALYVNGLLFTGCAHNGIENILEACPWPVHSVFGGFHLLDPKGGDSFESENRLRDLAGHLASDYPETRFYTSHCTGDRAFQTMKEVLGGRLSEFKCGMIIKI